MKMRIEIDLRGATKLGLGLFDHLKI